LRITDRLCGPTWSLTSKSAISLICESVLAPPVLKTLRVTQISPLPPVNVNPLSTPSAGPLAIVGAVTCVPTGRADHGALQLVTVERRVP
jgi:hypothetical protein